MPFITERMLRDYASDPVRNNARINFITASRSQAQKTIFLSHSHRDRQLVKGLINYFASMNIRLYVDWNDSDMPAITNRDTANQIKHKISENERFLILATENAMKSRWVPWEIGVADQMKTNSNIAIIPIVRENDSEFEGNEYLQLYSIFKLNTGIGGQIKLYEAGSWSRFTEPVQWLR